MTRPVLRPALRFDVVARNVSNTLNDSDATFLGRIEPRLDITMPGGASLGLDGNYEFGGEQQFFGGSLKFSVGFN
ncbi:MAG: hypothetical protein ABIK36_09470 [Pseudomonadota bacterium]